MANHLGVPGVSVQDVAYLRASGSVTIFLDVRETPELALASLGPEVIHIPMSALAVRGPEALPQMMTADPSATMIVFCHHGLRSAQVVAWLRRKGFTNTYNMDGGIDAYATEVDAAVGSY